MRITLTLDDDLVERARDLTGIREDSALVTAALEALVEREGSRRRAPSEAAAPEPPAPPRRRGH